MNNPLARQYGGEEEDRRLVHSAVSGDRHSLEQLIRRHERWIYNIALRMVWWPEDAQDVSQEILIKVVTRLSSFRGESEFRTWLYRIVANHVANMRRKRAEHTFSSFSEYGASIEATPDMALPDAAALPADLGLILEETRLSCMMGMILCLDRPHRLSFVLGALLGADAPTGAEILGITAACFRQRLCRGRQRLAQFMGEKCGLMRENNPCHCARKTHALILAGHIEPTQLRFTATDTLCVKEIARVRLRELDGALEARSQDLLQDQPFYRSPDFVHALQETIGDSRLQRVLSMH